MDESGFQLPPGVVKTYAPRARAPVLGEWQARELLSVMGGPTRMGEAYTPVRPKSLDGLHTIEPLLRVGRLAVARLLVIRDGPPVDRRAEVSELVAGTKGAAPVERLPPHAPDLNPVEWLGRRLEEVELRNLTCLDLDRLQLALDRLRQKPRLAPPFFEGAGLPI